MTEPGPAEVVEDEHARALLATVGSAGGHGRPGAHRDGDRDTRAVEQPQRREGVVLDAARPELRQPLSDVAFPEDGVLGEVDAGDAEGRGAEIARRDAGIGHRRVDGREHRVEGVLDARGAVDVATPAPAAAEDHALAVDDEGDRLGVAGIDGQVRPAGERRSPARGLEIRAHRRRRSGR
jgi:hypothetical protein